MRPLAVLPACMALALSLASTAASAAPSDPSDAGVRLDMRYRIEQVDQGGFDRNALASTLRTRLGYQTARHEGWSAFVSMQDNRAVGDDRYNSTRNGRSDYPVVADPGDTELDQAYLEYRGVNALDLRAGRQVIKLDNDRFIGNVGFRQLEQSFDALRATWTPASTLRIDYAYLTRVNRVFGAHHPDPLHARQNLDTHLLNASWMPRYGTLTAYLYLIGNQSLPATSHRDVGLRWTGHAGRTQDWRLRYLLEAARQHAWKDGTLDGSRAYLHAEASLSRARWSGRIGHERLGGNGIRAFQTPLATLHAFNGWADVFLVTPANGLADTYAGLGWKSHRLDLKATAHRFASTRGSSHYGNELDVSAGLRLTRKLKTSLALADYRADRYAVDKRVVWFTVQYTH